MDGLRAVAALYVVATHALLEFWGPGPAMPTTPGMHAVATFLMYGHMAVNVFIVLSGFCLGLPVAKAGGILPGGVGPFLKRRAWRILPPYFLATALCLALIATVVGEKTGTHWDRSAAVTPAGIAAHLLLLQDMFSAWVGGQINHCFWSIAVEWHIYLAFPLIVLSWRTFGIVRSSLAWCAGSIILQILLRDTRCAGLHLHYVALFCFGALAAKACFSPGPRARAVAAWPWGWLALGLWAASFAALVVVPWGRWTRNWPAIDPVSGLATAAALVFFARNPGSIATRCFSARWLVFLGEYSYSTYLIHAPFLQIAWLIVMRGLHLDRFTGFWLVVIAGIPLILAISYVFFLLCERPFIARRDRRKAAVQEPVGAQA